MGDSLPEYEPGGGNEWREYICYEAPDGHTFDPIAYLCACWEPDSTPADDRYDTWEDLYINHPGFLASHLVSVAEKVDEADSDLRESLIRSALRIGSTLSRTHHGYGSFGDVIESVFWLYFDRGEFDRLEDFQQDFQYCAEESVHFMKEALSDPIDYTVKLILRDAN